MQRLRDSAPCKFRTSIATTESHQHSYLFSLFDKAHTAAHPLDSKNRAMLIIFMISLIIWVRRSPAITLGANV